LLGRIRTHRMHACIMLITRPHLCFTPSKCHQQSKSRHHLACFHHNEPAPMPLLYALPIMSVHVHVASKRALVVLSQCQQRFKSIPVRCTPL
jgi:hypothetical protein